MHCAAPKAHANAAAPQNGAADSPVGIAEYGVVGVTAFGAKRPEIDVRAPADRSNRLPSFITRESAIPYAYFVSCRIRARSDGLRSAGGSACTADVPLPDRFQRLNP